MPIRCNDALISREIIKPSLSLVYGVLRIPTNIIAKSIREAANGTIPSPLSNSWAISIVLRNTTKYVYFKRIVAFLKRGI
jgi:hypothetical protein